MATLAAVFGVVATAFAAAIAMMAVGVMLRRPCLRGSCGGPAIHGPDGVKISCATCPNRRRKAV
ncbi:MAG: hypothetical protein COW75_10465 [Rhodobacterales bacterium CG18_big_fil_WC_8_21_14_2_50_71_9]|nr:MAG: hypothetical protein COW75_10465 [Rhodobacterales bacterium CG18_big_fil_WC_8_21_14_2_50_71_9]PJA60075.1 MAG: hypothetical protein CO163_05785 [Rhodobacterales bacterium CG_4_9_14_3_um_filter_71_31]